MSRRHARAHRPVRPVSVVAREQWQGEEWLVRRVSGAGATKPYRCPGCQQLLPPATPHVVVWPEDLGDGLTDRRHWHSSCWQARDRRRPL